MKQIEKTIERLYRQGIHPSRQPFLGTTPNDDYLQDGETFIIPEDFQVFEQNLHSHIVQFTLAETTTGRIVRIYPAMFTIRKRNAMNDLFETPSGTVIDFMKNCSTIDEFFKNIAGKQIQSMAKNFPTATPDGRMYTTSVWNFDFVLTLKVISYFSHLKRE